MLLAASTFYLLVIFGVMLARGISIEPQWVVLALLLIAVAMGRGGQFIKDWAPIVVRFIFWTRSREHYWRFISALLLMSFLAFLTYLFYPSVPPRLQFPHQVHWVTDETVKKLFNNYYISPIYSHLNPNQFAAFP